MFSFCVESKSCIEALRTWEVDINPPMLVFIAYFNVAVS